MGSSYLRPEHMQFAAQPGLGLYVCLPPMALANALNQGQPRAHAFKLIFAVHALKNTKQAIGARAVKAAAVITHHHLPAAFDRLHRHANTGQCLLATELDSVGQRSRQSLLQQRCIRLKLHPA